MRPRSDVSMPESDLLGEPLSDLDQELFALYATVGQLLGERRQQLDPSTRRHLIEIQASFRQVMNNRAVVCEFGTELDL